MTTATQRNDRINKLYKVAKKHYQPLLPPANRTVIEHMLYSCCLEDAPYELADEAFARLQQEYFDWNEVRVTTTAELAEVMKRLPQPEEASNRIRRSLHGLFEAHYSFDLEFLKKENLGKAVEQLGKYRGMTPFCISYSAQVALGGHSIPVDLSLIELLKALDIVSESDAASMKVTGLERTIPKNKGVEFASVVHQLAVAYASSPFNKSIREIVLEIDADAKDRFPRRGGRKKADEVEETLEPEVVATKPEKVKKLTAAERKAAEAAAVKKQAAGKKQAAIKPPPAKKQIAKKPIPQAKSPKKASKSVPPPKKAAKKVIRRKPR